MQKLFSKFFSIFFFLKINRISTEFFFTYKRIAKIIFNIFSEFFVFEKFFYENFVFTNFFFVKIFLSIFFGENFFFYTNISTMIFFTIFSRIPSVFDVCEIMYFAKFFIRNFVYCEFFCFTILVWGKKNCKYSQRWTWIPILKMFLFSEKK